MDRRHVRNRLGLGPILLCLGLTACAPSTAVENLPTADATLAAAGKRLSAAYSVANLTEIAARGDKVLDALTRAERDALARGYLRFTIDRSAMIRVAAPHGFEPFWLADQGFRRIDELMSDSEQTWSLYEKRFEPGWVGFGVNGLDQNAPAHYAVFVTAIDGKPITIAPRNQAGWEVLPAGDGVTLEAGITRPVAQLPTSLAGATLIRCDHAQRHSTMLARGRVWKTHVVSGQKPDQIVVSFGSDPRTELTWSWRTSPAIDRSLVRLRRAGDPQIHEFSGTPESITLPELLNDPTILRHTVRVTGLASDQAYEYAVGDGTSTGMSAWTPIRTGPQTASKVSLMYMGDPQCGLENWGKLLADAYRKHPEVRTLLIAGDLVDRGNERSNWDHFFMRASGVFDRLPLMPAIGNHEYLDRGPWLYRAFFDLPANGPESVKPDLTYHFEMGDAFIAVLDSELAITDPAMAKVQADWLDKRLSETKRTWKLVMYHHPVYASHIDRQNLELRDAWVPIFDRHHVDLVLQGHDHSYLRTYPLKGGHRAVSTAEGTVYVVSVSGDKYYDQDMRGVGEVGFANTSTYQIIDIDPAQRRLVYRSIDASGREVDGFVIDKPSLPQAIVER